LALRELAQRIQLLDDQRTRTTVRLRRICTAVAAELVARKGAGPDTALRDPHQRRRQPAPAATVKSTLASGESRSSGAPPIRPIAHTSPAAAEGKSKTETIRCIKRYIAREVFTVLPRQADRLTVGASAMFAPVRMVTRANDHSC